MSNPARKTFGPAAERGHCHGQQRRQKICANAKEAQRRSRPSGRGTRALGGRNTRPGTCLDPSLMVESRASSPGWRDGRGRPWLHQQSVRLQSSLHLSGGPMFQNDLLQSKRIMITGGGSGLGTDPAHRFVGLGAEVHICGRRQEVLAATEKELRERTGGKIHSHPCDVRNAAAVEEMIAAIWAEAPLDALMNNAAGNFLARTEDLSLGAFQSVIGIVLMGTLHTTMACGRRWLAAGHKGVVLNITTTYTTTGSAYVVPSAVAKAGGQALTRSLAVEWGKRGTR